MRMEGEECRDRARRRQHDHGAARPDCSRQSHGTRRMPGGPRNRRDAGEVKTSRNRPDQMLRNHNHNMALFRINKTKPR
jgi:hypothetical protein